MAKRFRKVKPTIRDGTIALRDHLLSVAELARHRYGDNLSRAGVEALLEDREIVRYPVTLVFDDTPLQMGEYGFPEPVGCRPQDGFRLYLHPHYENREDVLALLVVYQLVRINYGDVASHEEAEVFGASLCGMDQDEYYETLCTLVDSIPTPAC